MPQIQTITPCLWFDGQAEQAAQHYVSIFPGSRLLGMVRWPEGAPVPAGSVLTVTFQLAGQEFIGLKGGPQFKFNEAISLSVRCDSQDEVDRYWARLGEGGSFSQCGWLKDRYGVSWQVVPTVLVELLESADPARAARAMQAMMPMQRIEIAALLRAAD